MGVLPGSDEGIVGRHLDVPGHLFPGKVEGVNRSPNVGAFPGNFVDALWSVVFDSAICLPHIAVVRENADWLGGKWQTDPKQERQLGHGAVILSRLAIAA